MRWLLRDRKARSTETDETKTSKRKSSLWLLCDCVLVLSCILPYGSHDFQCLLSWMNSKISLRVLRKLSFPLSSLGWKETCSLLIAQPHSPQRLAVCSLLLGFSVGCLCLPCSVPWSFNSGPLGNQAVCLFPPEWKHSSVASILQEDFFHTAQLVLHFKAV